jgi:GH35 family endo-1,4-beta-xylanase
MILATCAVLLGGWIQADWPDLVAPDVDSLRFTGVRADVEDGIAVIQVDPAPGANPWVQAVHSPTLIPLAKGNTVVYEADMRSATRNRIAIFMERSTDPHEKFMGRLVKLGTEWKTIRLVGTSSDDFAPGGAQLAMHLGYGKGTIEIRKLRVRNAKGTPMSQIKETVDLYGGETVSNAWKPAAEQRIERFRKGPITVRVVDARGRPVRDAQVRIEQQKHHFRFGTAIPAFRINAQDPDSVQFRKVLLRLFNTVVFENDLKWNQFANQDYSEVDKAMPWLVKHGYAVRGHNLVWGSNRWLPEEMRTMPVPEARAAIERRVRETVARFKGQLYVWDVVNEAATERELWDRVGWDTFANTFKWTKQTDPKVLTCYNDFDVTEENQARPSQKADVKDRIRRILDAGAPLDIIGLQGHVSVPLTPVSRVVEILDEMAQYGKPLEITEYDVSLQDDAEHARYTRDYLTACFANPRMRSFLMWGFWEGQHWRAEVGGAMFRRDWSERPTVKVWEDLTRKVWWTRAVRRSDRRGEARTRAFYGDYAVSAVAGGRVGRATLRLEPGGKNLVVVRLP